MWTKSYFPQGWWINDDNISQSSTLRVMMINRSVRIQLLSRKDNAWFKNYEGYSESKVRIATANQMPCKHQMISDKYRLPACFAYQTTVVALVLFAVCCLHCQLKIYQTIYQTAGCEIRSVIRFLQEEMCHQWTFIDK